MSVITDNQKEIYQLMSAGTAFLNPLESGLSTVTSSVTNVKSLSTSLTQNLTNEDYASDLQSVGLTSNLLKNLSTGVESFTSASQQLSSYGSKSISEFSQRAQIADSYTNTHSAMTGEDLGCSAIDSTLGIVKSTGSEMLSAYNTAVSKASQAIQKVNDAITAGESTVKELATEAVTEINSLISQAEGVVQEVTDAITKETEAIASQVQASANAWVAKNLSGWFSDSCKSNVLSSISTSELKSKIS